jgi:hypothetical protein
MCMCGVFLLGRGIPHLRLCLAAKAFGPGLQPLAVVPLEWDALAPVQLHDPPRHVVQEVPWTPKKERSGALLSYHVGQEVAGAPKKETLGALLSYYVGQEVPGAQKQGNQNRSFSSCCTASFPGFAEIQSHGPLPIVSARKHLGRQKAEKNRSTLFLVVGQLLHICFLPWTLRF